MATQRSGTPRSADSVLGIPSLELVQGVLKRLPSTHSVSILGAIRDGDYQRAAEYRVDPLVYQDWQEFALDFLCCSLIRKYPGLPGSKDKAEKAIVKWLECEEQCRVTNERLKEFRMGQVRPDLHEPFRLARKIIQNILGSFAWRRVYRFFDFGPGSTTRLPFSRRHPSYKYGESPETTYDNLASACAVIGMSPAWCKSSGGYYTSIPLPCLKIREESKVTTVPKDAFIDRVIAVEPDMNMYVQKGIGGFIRHRLRKHGINLNDQSLNQLLARDGSRGGLATIDLSSASDTVSFELVRELLPPDWFEALLSCRTHASRLPSGEITSLQKFSAMGNGFTFELESMIFYALCLAVCTHKLGREGLRASVYGDDIIVAVEDFDKVVDILEFSGFTVNKKKTHASGPYRESCGKHYFHGHDVTPITITKEVTHASQLLLLCNNLTRWAVRTSSCSGRNSDVREAYTWAVAHLPPHFQRPRIPDGYGDGALIGPFDICRPQRCSRGWDGWRVGGVLLEQQRYRPTGGVATLTACLSTLERHSKPDAQSSALHRRFEKIFGEGVRTGVESRRDVADGGRSVGKKSPCFRQGDLFIHELVRQSALESASVGGTHSSPALIPTQVRAKLKKVFIPQWGNDIGPWV